MAHYNDGMTLNTPPPLMPRSPEMVNLVMRGSHSLSHISDGNGMYYEQEEDVDNGIINQVHNYGPRAPLDPYTGFSYKPDMLLKQDYDKQEGTSVSFITNTSTNKYSIIKHHPDGYIYIKPQRELKLRVNNLSPNTRIEFMVTFIGNNNFAVEVNPQDRESDGRPLCDCFNSHQESSFCVLETLTTANAIHWERKENNTIAATFTPNNPTHEFEMMFYYLNSKLISSNFDSTCRSAKEVQLNINVYDSYRGNVVELSYPLRVCKNPKRDQKSKMQPKTPKLEIIPSVPISNPNITVVPLLPKHEPEEQPWISIQMNSKFDTDFVVAMIERFNGTYKMCQPC